MTGGILQLYITTITTPQLVYTVPSSITATLTCNICNQTTADIKVAVSINTSGAPTTKSYLVFGYKLYPGENLILNGIVLGATQNLYVTTDTSNVSVNLYGFTQ